MCLSVTDWPCLRKAEKGRLCNVFGKTGRFCLRRFVCMWMIFYMEILPCRSPCKTFCFTVLVGGYGSLYTCCWATKTPGHGICTPLRFMHRSVLSVKQYSLRAGFEPAREDPIGFQVQRLNHSAITARNLKTASSIGILRTYGAKSMHVFNGESGK